MGGMYTFFESFSAKGLSLTFSSILPLLALTMAGSTPFLMTSFWTFFTSLVSAPRSMSFLS